MIRPIRIKNPDDIEKICKIVSGYPFDIWIHSKSGMVDAKSILGMYILKINEPLTLVIPDDVEPKQLFNDLKDYLEIG